MKIRQLAAAVAAIASVATGFSMMSPARAEAATAASCTGTRNVHCSMYWAQQTGSAAYAGARNSQVTALQKSLQQLGYFVETGTWGSWTTYEVKRYQYDRGLSQTGTLSAATRAALTGGAGIHRRAGSSAPKAPATRATSATSYAYRAIGKPYVYGATGPYSFDCSGLVYAAYRSTGLTVPRTSYSQMTLRTVSRSALQPGDIVIFYGGGHVGLYVGGGYVIHASRPGVPVKKALVSSMPFTKAVRPTTWS